MLFSTWIRPRMGQDSDKNKKDTSFPQKKQFQPVGPALKLALISISAALYATAIGITSPISTPWGVGQFRPGVVFPSIFAIVYGPFVGGLGAAIGTFVGDIVFLVPLNLTTPLLSLVAGVPGNFIGFYLMGWFMRKYRSWNGFVFGSFIALLVGNLVCAIGVVGYLTLTLTWPGLSADALLGAVFGFTFFWLVTMIPFVVPLVPPLVKALQPLVGSRIDFGFFGWRKDSGKEAFKSSIYVGGVLGILFLVVQFTSLGDSLFGLVAGAPVYSLAEAVIPYSCFSGHNLWYRR